MQQSANLPNLCAPRYGYLLRALSVAIFFILAASFGSNSWAGNKILGEVQLKAASKVEKSAGIWVDGQYLGYLQELKGSKKILLLPGQHEITARLTGHLDFETQVEVAAGEKTVIPVALREKLDAKYPDPDEMANIKVMVKPDRAAVFVNKRYVGHVNEFRGIGKSLGLAPGTYKIHITLPGYRPFETEMTLLKQQDYEIKTQLQKGDPAEIDRLTNREPAADSEKIADAG